MEKLAIKILLDISNLNDKYITYYNYNNEMENLDSLEKLIRFDHAIKYLQKNNYLTIDNSKNVIERMQNCIAIIDKQGLSINSKGIEMIRESI